MDSDALDNPAVSSFLDEVEKEIILEAPADIWKQPREGDVVTVDISGGEAGAELRTWLVGAEEPPIASGVDLDRCVRTMRRGEECTVRPRGERAVKATTLHLRAHEQEEDLLGDGRLVRTSLQDGTGWQTPQAGTELLIRFAWRAVGGAADGSAARSSCARPGHVTTIFLARRANGKAPEAHWYTGGGPLPKELADLVRELRNRFGGAVTLKTDGDGAVDPSQPIRRVVGADGAQLAAKSFPEVGLSPAEARVALKAVLAPPSGSPVTTWRTMREASITFEEGQCECTAADWLPSATGFRALSDLKTGQRCLVRVVPELAYGVRGLPEHSMPGGVPLEYDVELLKIMILEDVSLDGSGAAMKRTTCEGEGYARLIEGAEATLKVEARDDATGAVLVQERELTLTAASGKLCEAVEECMLTMKQAEVCELRCTRAEICADPELGLAPREGSAVVFRLELGQFENIDLFSPDEAARVKHCTKRKEVGTWFFQKHAWRRALKRYQHVTQTLAYLDHWKDEKAKKEALLLQRLCHLNAAACYLKLEAWAQAERSCSSVLKDDPENLKALFRKGQALTELAEYKEAELCFKQLLKLDSENKEAVRMLVRLRQFIKKEVGQEKEMFSRMARGLASEQQEASNGRPPDEKEQAAVSMSSPAQDAADEEAEDADDNAWLWGCAAFVVGAAAISLAGYILRERRR